MIPETITYDHQHLQPITIRIPDVPYRRKGRAAVGWVKAAKPGMQWSDLDRLLVKSWESRSILIRLEVPRSRTRDGTPREWMDSVEGLLPEISKKWTVELVYFGGSPDSSESLWTLQL
jgi:hypothetical protein